ncbi:MAG TPA: PAS domain S-box protein [Caulobacteraceae bacterium]
MTLFRAVADGSNLTLDTDLDSYYAMNAATVDLPALLAASVALSRTSNAQDQATARRDLQIYASAAEDALSAAMERDASGHARKALAAPLGALRAAVDSLTVAPASPAQSPAQQAGLQREIDAAWKADSAELTRMLRARIARLQRNFMINLGVVIFALGFAGLLTIATARGMTDRLRGLLRTMDRLNAGDMTAKAPFLTDRHEIGRIAATLAAFRRGLVAAAEERERAEAANFAVHESEARLRFLTEHMTDLVMRYDRQDRRVFVSASCRRYGYEPEELLGDTGFSLSHPDDTPRLRALIDDLYAGSVSAAHTTTELRFRTKAGDWVWMEGSPTLIRNRQGEPVEFVWIMRDISARKAAQVALFESEARYRMLADSATDIIMRYGPGGVIEFASPSVGQIGYQPDELLGRRLADVFDPDGDAGIQNRVDHLMQGLPLPGGEETLVRFRRPDGEWVWLEGKPSPIRDDTGAVIGAVTVLRDVTARKAMEAELERQRADLAASALVIEEAHRIALMAEDLAGVGHWRIDVASGAVHWSDGVYGIFGFDPADGMPPAQTSYDMYGDGEGERIRNLVHRARTEGAAYTYEASLTRTDGALRRVRASGAAERNAAGEVVTVFGIMIDVTEARLREDALRESEVRYRMLTDKATDIITRYDSAGVIEFISPAIAQLGYRPEDLLGRNIREFTHPDELRSGLERLSDLMLGRFTRRGHTLELRARKADGEWIWLESNPSAIEDGHGRIIGAMTVLRDVTARRALEDELRRKQAEAEAAALAKAEFLANMSHEIRTPLTGVIGFAGLLARMEGLPEKAQTYTKRITTGGQALLSLVNDILDFSRIEAGQIELNPQPFDLRAFVEDTVDLVRPEAEAKGLDVRFEPSATLPAIVRADSERMRQVLLNLIGNAIKFTAKGGVTVRLDHLAANGDHIRFSVSDTGVGISADHSDRLFQRFSQIDGSNTRRYGGAGLGLAISKGLVELMGGQIGVTSEEGLGSTFWFTVSAPLVSGAGEVAAKEAGGKDMGPLRILIVDDVAVNRELVTALLSPFDLQLTEAANGAEAVDAALRDPFDLILMDLQMPVMDGLAATRAIRSNSVFNNATPILAVSANVMPPQVEACRAAGMNDHIAKPIDPTSLLSKIAQWTTPAMLDGPAA